MTPQGLKHWLLARRERAALSGPFDLALSLALDRAAAAAEQAELEQRALDVARFLADVEATADELVT